MARKMVAWIWGMFVVVTLASPGYAQLDRGTMEGTVIDPQGAFIPGVKVAVTSTETNITLPPSPTPLAISESWTFHQVSIRFTLRLAGFPRSI